MANDQRPLHITEASFISGAHGGLHPAALPGGYFAQGLNLSVRGGFARTRPRFKTLGSLEDAGDFKGVGVYSLNEGDELYVGVGKTVHIFDLETLAWTGSFAFETETDQMYFVQSDRFFIVQNGVDRPWFIHRGEFQRRANPDGDAERELPTGTIMAYAHGRTFVVPSFLYDDAGAVTTTSGKPYWLAGDIMLPLNPENVLKVTEDTYWQTGGATALPFESGFITGLAVLHNAASSGTGLGALLAFGRGGVSAYVVSAGRADWKDLDFSQVLFTGAGTESPKAIVPVNDDLIFRAVDGIRSLRVSTQQASGSAGSWSIKPMSFEVDHRLSMDAPADMPYVTSTFADNRFLITSAGRHGDHFHGIIALDTLVSSTLTQSTPPAYNDLWVSKPMGAVTTARKAKNPIPIAITEGNGGYIVATLSDEEKLDFGTEYPKCRLYTRAYSPKTMERIKLLYADLIFRDIDGPITAQVYYRSDQYARWTPCSGVLNVSAGTTRSHTRFSAAISGCREDGSPPNVGHSIQLCIEWDGVATLERVGVTMEPVPTDPAAISACGSTRTTISSDLDLVMKTLDDVEDALVTT